MAFYKVSISAHKKWFDHSKLKMVQEDIDKVYYVEEDSSFEALIIADKLLITAYGLSAKRNLCNISNAFYA